MPAPVTPCLVRARFAPWAASPSEVSVLAGHRLVGGADGLDRIEHWRVGSTAASGICARMARYSGTLLITVPPRARMRARTAGCHVGPDVHRNQFGFGHGIRVRRLLAGRCDRPPWLPAPICFRWLPAPHRLRWLFTPIRPRESSVASPRPGVANLSFAEQASAATSRPAPPQSAGRPSSVGGSSANVGATPQTNPRRSPRTRTTPARRPHSLPGTREPSEHKGCPVRFIPGCSSSDTRPTNRTASVVRSRTRKMKGRSMVSVTGSAAARVMPTVPPQWPPSPRSPLHQPTRTPGGRRR